MSQFKDLVIGSLLHDIGKLVQRADPNPSSKTHQQFGADWLEEFDFLKKYSAYSLWHHTREARQEKVPLLMVVNAADMLAAGERTKHEEDAKTSWEREIPLLSIFSKIRVDDGDSIPGEASVSSPRYYPLKQADKVFFPCHLHDEIKGTREAYAALLSGLETDIRAIERAFGVNTLLVLLEKYLSYVPGDTRVEGGAPERDPDISLFDHLKLTAAISSCLYGYIIEKQPDVDGWDEEFIYDAAEKRYIVLDADLSGIQPFIYNISSKGALRSLRARSFYLEMVCENIANRILHTCGLERVNLIFSGGGRLRLLMPNTEKAREAARETEKAANAFFRDELSGSIGLNVAWEEFAGLEMMRSSEQGGESQRSYKKVLEDLRVKLETRKKERIIDELIERRFEMLGPFEPGEDECRICHCESDELEPLREHAEGEEPVLSCPLCRDLYVLGGSLRGLERLWMSEDEVSGYHSLRLPFGHLLWPKDEEASEPEGGWGIVLDKRWDADSYHSPNDYGLSYPHYREGEDFEDLAEKSCGAHWLGILRMDVDDLGRIFGGGIPEQEMSFTRISVLSRLMNNYFREVLPSVLRGGAEGYENFTVLEDTRFPRPLEIVYAGGDDLFIVGAWNHIIEAAFDIRETFALYTCENQGIHISGGIVISRHDHPLYDLARIAEIAENNAKSVDRSKDRIEIFGRTGKWQKYSRAVEQLLLPFLNLGEGKGVAKKTENGNKHAELALSRAFLRNVMAIARRYESLQRSGESGKLAFPYLAYTVARARETIKKDGHNGGELPERWMTLERALFDIGNYDILYSLASWADLLSRGGRTDE